MKSATPILAALLIFSALVATAEPTPEAASSEARPLNICVSVPPLADLVQRVGGARVVAHSLLPDDTTPHNYNPRPQQLALLKEMNACVLVGHPAFVFESRQLAATLAMAEHLPTVRMSDSVDLAQDTDGADLDPHMWLAPDVVQSTAVRLSALLQQIDPEHAADHVARLARFTDSVAQLDAEIAERLAPHRGSTFLVLHPAWGWFARHYGLRQLALEHEGKEPGPRRVIPIIAEARRSGIRTVFVQRGYPERSAEWIAREIGGERVELDPMARDWAANLRDVSHKIARSFHDG